MIKEACVETLAECQYAIYHGANQLEVCSLLDLDGLTPEIKLIEKLITHSDIPIKVMIRSRGGDFYYDRNEIEEMVNTLKKFKKFPIQGYVFGALKTDATGRNIIDMDAVKQICQSADPFPVTFHKAIDLCENIVEEATKLKTFPNIRFILTSGGKSTAMEGVSTLIEIQDAVKPAIQVIAAGKVTSQNISEIREKTGLNYFHGRKIV